MGSDGRLSKFDTVCQQSMLEQHVNAAALDGQRSVDKWFRKENINFTTGPVVRCGSE